FLCGLPYTQQITRKPLRPMGFRVKTEPYRGPNTRRKALCRKGFSVGKPRRGHPISRRRSVGSAFRPALHTGIALGQEVELCVLLGVAEWSGVVLLDHRDGRPGVVGKPFEVDALLHGDGDERVARGQELPRSDAGRTQGAVPVLFDEAVKVDRM